MTTTRETLQAARDLITDPAHWTQHILARRADGSACLPDDPAATRWCAAGALAKIADADGIIEGISQKLILSRYDNRYQHAWAALTAIVGDLGHYNDHHTHTDIINLFDRTIEACAE